MEKEQKEPINKDLMELCKASQDGRLLKQMIKAKKLVIEEIYAFVAENDKGEGLMGFGSSIGPIPMIGADMKRVKSLYPMALKYSQATKVKFKILRFSKREDITERYAKKME